MRLTWHGAVSITLVTLLLCASLGILYIGNGLDSHAASYPVNGRVVFSSSRDGNFELYLMDSDGTNEERLTNNAAADLSPSWSPNGTKIAFVRADVIYVMEANGTNVKKLTHSGLLSSDPEWSPDGSKILFSAITDGTDRDIYVIDQSDGLAIDITEGSSTDDFEPTWSPDGNRILFTSPTNGSKFGIFTMNANGQQRSLLVSNGSSMQADWSPDGKKIVFAGNLTRNFDIYTIEIDGSNMTKLTFGNSNKSHPSWSPDGKKIIFSGNIGTRNEQIHIMDSDGSDLKRLTRNLQKDLSPDIQPLKTPVKEKLPILRENGMIAFVSDRNGTSAEIYVMLSDGTNVTQLTSIAEAEDSLPKWSPTGDKIAFVSTLDGYEEIVVVDSNGTNRVSLTKSTSPFSGLGWSPDGKQLVFSKGDSNHKWIFVMNSDGSSARRLTITPSLDTDPSWSPDGEKIAFSRDLGFGNVEIYVIDKDGSDEKKLTNLPGRDYYPRWSPEGDQIAFVTDRDGNDEVYVMNSDGRRGKNLSNNTATDLFPSWSPDGTLIAFVSDRLEDGQDIHVMDSEGKSVKRLTSMDGDEKQPDFGATTVSNDGPVEIPPVEEPEIPTLPLNVSLPVLRMGNSPPLGNITAGEEVVIATTLTNNHQDRAWNLVAVIQVRDENGITQYIDQRTAIVAPGGSVEIGSPWTPENTGSYELRIFLIENSENPEVLGSPASSYVTISD